MTSILYLYTCEHLDFEILKISYMVVGVDKGRRLLMVN